MGQELEAIQQEPFPEKPLGKYLIFVGGKCPSYLRGYHTLPSRVQKKRLSRLKADTKKLVRRKGMHLAPNNNALAVHVTGRGKLLARAIIMESHIMIYIDSIDNTCEIQVCTCGRGAEKVSEQLINDFTRRYLGTKGFTLCPDRCWLMSPRQSDSGNLVNFPQQEIGVPPEQKDAMRHAAAG